VTGSPLPPGSFRWVYEAVGPGLAMHVISGGTDFAAALVCDAPWLPVTEGEMSCRGRGIHVESWDEQGRPLLDEVGELVLLAPMPSMPLGIWGDADGSRYREAYFAPPYPAWPPGVWRHGDWMTLTSRGTAVVHGRSDSTLNRHGVRMGSADIYAAVESAPEVLEALVLGIELPDGGYWLPLFVALAPGVALDERPHHLAQDHGPRPGLPAARPGRGDRGARSPAHRHRKKARGSAQAHRAGHAGRARPQPRGRRQPRRRLWFVEYFAQRGR